MKTVTIIAALAVVAVAAPSPSEDPVFHVGKRDVDKCNNAANCEVYSTPEGTRIRFKAGMEPGTAKYKAMFAATKVPAAKVARDNSFNTHVTLGPTTINYGTDQPHDVMKQNLPSVCPTSGSCLEANPATVTILMGIQKGSIQMAASGQYNPKDRDTFVSAIAAAVSKGVKVKQQETCTEIKRDLSESEGADEAELERRLDIPPPPICHKINVNEQTNFVSINRFQGDLLEGFMTVTVTKNTDGNGWCAILTGLIGAGLGAVTDGVGAVAAGFFGVLASAACGL